MRINFLGKTTIGNILIFRTNILVKDKCGSDICVSKRRQYFEKKAKPISNNKNNLNH